MSDLKTRNPQDEGVLGGAYPGHSWFQLLCYSNCWVSLVFSPPSQIFKCPIALRLCPFGNSGLSSSLSCSPDGCLPLPCASRTTTTFHLDWTPDGLAKPPTLSVPIAGSVFYPAIANLSQCTWFIPAQGWGTVGHGLAASWPSVIHFIVRQWDGRRSLRIWKFAGGCLQAGGGESGLDSAFLVRELCPCPGVPISRHS